MSSIEKRIQRAEEVLGMEQELVVCRVVYFGGGPLPPEERRGNVIIRHVAYESIQHGRKEGPDDEP